MDPSSAIGLVAAVVELVRTAKDVTKRVNDFVSQTEEVPRVFRVLHLRLPVMTLVLENIKKQSENEALAPAHLTALSNIARTCTEKIDELDTRLQRLLPVSEDNNAVRIKKAFKSIKCDFKVQRSAEELNELFDLLNWYRTARDSLKIDQICSRGAQQLSEPSEPLALALVQKPSFLQEQLDDVTNTTAGTVVAVNDVSSTYSQSPRSHIRRRECTCRRRKQRTIESSSSSILGLEMSHSMSNAHLPSCDLYFPSNDFKRASLRLKIPEFLLRRAIYLTCSYDYGAGGSSMSASLQLKGVMRDDSPAFALVEQVLNTSPLLNPEVLERLCLSIETLFRTRQASPNELNETGRTLLEVLVGALHFGIRSQADLSQCVTLIKRFTNLGVPLQEATRKYTVLDWLLFAIIELLNRPAREASQSIDINLCNQIEEVKDIGAETNSFESHYPPYLYISLMKRLPDYRDVFNCNSLQLAILQRSRADVEKIIKTDPSSVREGNLYGQQALHLATDWPWAVQFLLEHGANSSGVDRSGWNSLYYAIREKNVESIKILTAEDRYLGFSILDLATNEFDKDVFATLAQVIARRRRELASLAIQHLTPETVCETHVNQGSTPDLEAMEIMRMLEKENYEVDHKYYLLGGRSVYEHYKASSKTFQSLYDAGFTNINGPLKGDIVLVQVLLPWKDAHHYMMSYQADIWFWLHEKGASLALPVLQLPPSYTGILCVHLCAAQVGHLVRYRYEDFDQCYFDHALRLILVVLSAQYATCTDSCNCLCSENGCTPATDILKVLCRERGTVERRWGFSEDREGKNERLGWQSTAICHISRHISNTNDKKIFYTAAIRMAIFQSLGLHHLCCPVGRGDFDTLIDEEEAQELRDENRDATKDFATLLPQALQQWEQTESTFGLFWREFYDQNIRPKLDDRDEDYEKRVEELGVCIEEDSPASL